MQDLICYKQMPVWTKENLPQMFQEKHNTKAGIWAKLTILQGALKYSEVTEQGEIVQQQVFDVDNPIPFISPQVWHKVEPLTEDLRCQLAFYCQPRDYFVKKYNLTATHSEVINTVNHISSGKALDLGCGRGRNSLYLNSLGFEVTAVDHSRESITFLNRIITQEEIKHLQTEIYDINQADISGNYDLIISTVVMMFLQRDRIPSIIKNMQDNTKINGYNLIVCAMDTAEYPCSMPFSFTFKENELADYYQGWEMIKYTEELGHLHKTDENGNRIQLKFVTMLAKKL